MSRIRLGRAALIKPQKAAVEEARGLIKFFTGARLMILVRDNLSHAEMQEDPHYRTATMLLRSGDRTGVSVDQAQSPMGVYHRLTTMPVGFRLYWQPVRDRVAWFNGQDICFTIPSLERRRPDLPTLQREFEVALESVPHELVHAMQFVAGPWTGRMSRPGGVPPVQMWPPGTAIDGVVFGEAGERVEHARRPVEFYPRLLDDADVVVRHLEHAPLPSRPELLEKCLVSGNRGAPSVQTLAAFKAAGDTNLYRKAVGLLYAEVASRVLIFNPKRPVPPLGRPSRATRSAFDEDRRAVEECIRIAEDDIDGDNDHAWENADWVAFEQQMHTELLFRGFTWIGSGASRAVYSRDPRYVFKIPYHAPGRDHLHEEHESWLALPDGIRTKWTAQILDVDSDGKWTASERVTPATRGAQPLHRRVPMWVLRIFSDNGYDTDWYNWGRRGRQIVLLDMECG